MIYHPWWHELCAKALFIEEGKVQNSFYGFRNDIKVACQLPTFSYIRMLASQNATLVLIEINKSEYLSKSYSCLNMFFHKSKVDSGKKA